MTDTILEAKQISKSYPMADGRQIAVLEDINLQVREGEFISILGASGAGKSSFLRILADLSEPSRGEVLYHGKPLKTAGTKIAMVFQSFALFPWLSVVENVELGLKSAGASGDEARRKSVAMIDIVGLDGFEDAYPRELSGGMRQRVGIARALVLEPEVLFMDEPFSALDVLTADNLRSELAKLWSEKKMPIKSIIFVTHNIEEAVFLSDRAVILSHNPGTIKADVPIILPLPRDKNTKEFRLVLDHIYSILTKPAQEISFLLQQQRYQLLPHSKIGAIAGLMELVHDRGGMVDISVLASDLSMDVDDIFPLIEAAVFLEFGEIKDGNFVITEKGMLFSDADTLRKKEIFGETALDNIQLIKQIMQVLSAASKHRMNEEFFIEILQNHFTGEEAWRQLEIAIDWGRYAELFRYEYNRGELYLEPEDRQ